MSGLFDADGSVIPDPSARYYVVTLRRTRLNQKVQAGVLVFMALPGMEQASAQTLAGCLANVTVGEVREISREQAKALEDRVMPGMLPEQAS